MPGITSAFIDNVAKPITITMELQMTSRNLAQFNPFSMPIPEITLTSDPINIFRIIHDMGICDLDPDDQAKVNAFLNIGGPTEMTTAP